MKNKGLGRGLRALIPTEPEGDQQSGDIVQLPINKIQPGAFQARQEFDEEALEELAASIKEHGVMQPVVVRPIQDGKYELIIGERRWRASQIAGLETIPCVVRDVDDLSSSEMMLVENIQREDLNPLEEAQAYKRLIDEYHLTQDQIAARVGKSRSFIANSMRLLNLPSLIQDLLIQKKLSVGHGKVLLGIPDRQQQERLAQEIVEKGLSVREAEKVAQQLLQQNKKKVKPKTKTLDPEMADVEDRLRQLLGTKVKIKQGRRGGKIEIDFFSRDELDRLLELLFCCQNSSL
ncbi:MAG TPA: ParB/RepB/Spo0J family partition protein [Syntrophomonadaceae bacterium]|nr:ParB/RepB/Spo0J family partition protein [Syntrophomonadaceae bacterium]